MVERSTGPSWQVEGVREAPGAAGPAAEVPAIGPRSRPAEEIPPSHAQERLWILAQLGAAGSQDNLTLPLWLSGCLDEAALRRSVSEVVRRHESLRTRFAAVNGRPVPIIDRPRQVELAVRDLRRLPSVEREAQAASLMTCEAERSYDLVQGPLFRALLVWLEEERQVLLLAMHHIVSDAGSMRVLAREVGVLYDAFRAGGVSPLAPLPLQYADFAVWQREQLEGEGLDWLLDYWRRQLAEAPGLIELPADRPRPAVQSFRGASQGFLLPMNLSRALMTLGRAEGATLFMTLLAGFKALLHRYRDQDHIVIGAPAINRGRPELEGLIGPLTNTLVLHTDLAGDPSFRTLLARVREVALGAYAHQDLPYEKLVEALRPERNLGYAPLVQVMFALEGALPGEAVPSGVPPERGKVMPGPVKFDVSLRLHETGQGLLGRIDYATDLFDDATMTRLIGHFETLLESIAASPDARLSRLAWLPEAERLQLADRWNDTAGEIPQLCVHQWFEAYAAVRPDAVAVALEDMQVSYGALNRRANQLARHLRARGVGPHTRVGLCLARSVDMVVAVLAVHKAGSAYVPLDPTYPSERLELMLDDAALTVVVTHGETAACLPVSPTHRLQLDDEAAAIERQPWHDLSLAVRQDSVAYVIYTSGSTGRPKGVMVPHRGLSNVIAEQRRSFRLCPGDRVLQFFSLSFDISAWELMLALASGATLCLGTSETRRPGAPLTALLQRQHVTSVTLLPSVLATLPAAQLPAVRHIVSGAEPCTAEIVARWGQGRRFFNGYGPTEISICATLAPLSQGERNPPIGRPTLNTRTYVLDARGELLPVGAPGELAIGGAGVAHGYLGQTALTARRFVPDPYASRPGGRMYLTGDLVRQRVDGQLEFLGRIDRQVKLRGYRIELGDIDAALAAHPDIEEAVSLVRREAGAEPRLLAYFVARGTSPTAAELRAWLKARLPEYMVPAAFMPLPDMPRNPNGKIDHATLAAREPVVPASQDDGTPPRTSLEQAVAAIWADILGMPRVGIHESFFDIGGDSLLAVHVVAEIADTLHVDLSVRAIFEAPTVAQLAKKIEEQGQGDPSLRRDRTVSASSRAETDDLQQVPRVDIDAPFAQPVP